MERLSLLWPRGEKAEAGDRAEVLGGEDEGADRRDGQLGEVDAAELHAALGHAVERRADSRLSRTAVTRTCGGRCFLAVCGANLLGR